MNLSKYRLSFFILSSLIIIIGFIFIILGGLNPGIDFTGGATLTLKVPNVDSSSEVRDSLANTRYNNSIIQNFGDNTFNLFSISPYAKGFGPSFGVGLDVGLDGGLDV